MAEKNNLEKMLEMEDPIEFFDFATTCGLLQEHADFMKNLFIDIRKVEEGGGKTPDINRGHFTAGTEFQQGILITFGWKGSDEVCMGHAIAFDPTCTKIVGSKHYSPEEFRQNFKKLPKN